MVFSDNATEVDMCRTKKHRNIKFSFFDKVLNGDIFNSFQYLHTTGTLQSHFFGFFHLWVSVPLKKRVFENRCFFTKLPLKTYISLK